MWERWASNSAKTVRPTFIHHCSASAMQHDFSRHCAFRPFSVQIVFPAKPCYPLEVSGVVGRHKALYRTLVLFHMIHTLTPAVLSYSALRAELTHCFHVKNGYR